MKRPWIIIILFAYLLISCAPQDQTQQDKAVEIVNDELTVPITPICVEGFTGPEVISPKGIIGASPPHTFSWSIDCVPDNYFLEVSPYEDNSSPVIHGYFSIAEKEYVTHVPFEPATSYKWTLVAESSDGDSQISNTGFFKTGPICTAQELVAPTLISPADGSVDHGKGWGYLLEVATTITYPAGGCIPEKFEINLSMKPDFTKDGPVAPAWNLFGTGGYGKSEDGWLIYEDDTNGLYDCTKYYWHARGVAGNEFGPWSEPFSFFLDVYDNCSLVSEFKGLKNANCRSSPWVGENYVGIIREGETATLLGLNEDASWGMFKLQNELECWVNMNLLELQPPGAVFDPAFYEILEHSTAPKDTPVPAEEPSSGGDSPQGCMVPNRSGNLVCQIPCPDPKYAAGVCP